MTPYLEGSSTFVTQMVPSLPCFLWNAMSSLNGYSQVTSELRTKKGESSLRRVSAASFRGPAVPRGSVSTEKVMLIPKRLEY